MATTATHVSTQVQRGPTCAPPAARPPLLGLWPSFPPRGDTCARGARPAPPGVEHGLPHPGGSWSEHPPARDPPEPPRRGSCHLPRPPRRLWPPQPGRSRVGAAEGRGRAGTHRALRRRRRRAQLPAVPRARLLLCAEARALRPLPPALGKRAPAPPPGRRGHCAGLAPAAGPQKTLLWPLGLTVLHGPGTQGLAPAGQRVAGNAGKRVF